LVVLGDARKKRKTEIHFGANASERPQIYSSGVWDAQKHFGSTVWNIKFGKARTGRREIGK